MSTTAGGFDGVAGRVAATAMARLNRDMEEAAVAILDPAPDDSVLAIGFGPGVGVATLAARLGAGTGTIAGVDPSATMVDRARRRNRAAIATGRVRLAKAEAASIPWPDASFLGAIAVNSLQLWDPLDASAQEVARVLAPGGTLVTLTHRWAIEKRAPVGVWVRAAGAQLTRAGFVVVTTSTRPFRSGDGLVLCARAAGGDISE